MTPPPSPQRPRADIPVPVRRRAAPLWVILAVALAGVASVGIVAVASMIAYSSLTEQRKVVVDELRAKSRAAEREVTYAYRSILKAIQLATAFEGPRLMDPERQRIDLARIFAIVPEARTLEVFDTTGARMAFMSRYAGTADVSAVEPGFPVNRGNGDAWVSSLWFWPGTNEPFVTVKVQIEGANGIYAGTLHARVKLSFVWDVAEHLSMQSAHTVIVSDQSGVLLAHPDIARVLRGERVQASLLAALRETPTQTMVHEYTNDDGQVMLAAATKLDDPSWIVISEEPVSKAFAGVASRIRQAVVVASAIVVLAMIAGVLLARKLSGPIIRLTDSARELAQGKFDTPIVIEGGQEVQELGAAFEAMSRRIEETVSEMREEVAERQKTEVKLTQINEELKQFAYISSHDLQEPLRTITSYIQMLEKRLGDKLGDDELEYMRFVVISAKRMGQLIRDLLEYSRLDQKELVTSIVDLGQIVEETRRSLNEMIAESGAQLIAGDLPFVYGDRTLVRQAIQNLVVNALKYSDPSRQPLVEIIAYREDEHWVVSVRDNGIGMESVYLERIFNIFERLHSQEEYSGTGIGLAIVRRVVDRHDGRVWVESTVGEGSTFYFTLPALPDRGPEFTA